MKIKVLLLLSIIVLGTTSVICGSYALMGSLTIVIHHRTGVEPSGLAYVDSEDDPTFKKKVYTISNGCINVSGLTSGKSYYIYTRTPYGVYHFHYMGQKIIEVYL